VRRERVVTRYAVGCCFADYSANTVEVDAGSVEEALQKAVAKADMDDGWKRLDDAGPTFVCAASEGGDPWTDSLPLPPRFTERALFVDAEGARAALDAFGQLDDLLRSVFNATEILDPDDPHDVGRTTAAQLDAVMAYLAAQAALAEAAP